MRDGQYILSCFANREGLNDLIPRVYRFITERCDNEIIKVLLDDDLPIRSEIDDFTVLRFTRMENEIVIGVSLEPTRRQTQSLMSLLTASMMALVFHSKISAALAARIAADPSFPITSVQDSLAVDSVHISPADLVGTNNMVPFVVRDAAHLDALIGPNDEVMAVPLNEFDTLELER
jgi:hypothetical protein